jgi:hypothetical protein
MPTNAPKPPPAPPRPLTEGINHNIRGGVPAPDTATVKPPPPPPPPPKKK